jgi:outer membrane protein OmpA-like peptidoglycan-associated protein
MIGQGVFSMREHGTTPAKLALCCLAMCLLASCQMPSRGLNAAQIAVLKKEGFAPKGDGWELALSSKVLFDFDDDQLKPDTLQSITRMGEALHSVEITRVRVDGYTDNIGTDAYNIDLSQRRAESVAQALDSSGLSGGHVDVHGLGKSNPVADNKTEAGRAENRRVAIIVPDLQD